MNQSERKIKKLMVLNDWDYGQAIWYLFNKED